MPTVSDTLETVLRLVQLNTFVRGFEMIAQAIDQAAEAFIAYDTQLLRTQFFLQEFGHALPMSEITEFTRQVSLATGESQTHIAALEGYLARFRSSSDDVERATKVIVNASQATGVPLEELGRLIEKARAGHARGLWSELGIQVRGVEGQLYSLNQIIDIVDQHTRGFSDQFGQTLPGSLKKTQAAFEDMMVSLGQLLSPAILAFAQLLQVTFEAIAEAARSTANLFGISLPDLAGAAGAAGGLGAGNRTDQYLQQITFNTGPQGPMARALRGGGSFAEPGGGLPIRDFNLSFRAAR